jgi:hypothetical protein
VQKSVCDAFAKDNYPLDPKLTEAEVDAADNFLNDNVFVPYATANSLGAEYFGTVTLRASMQSCRSIGNNKPAANGLNPGAEGWVGNPMAVAP